MKHAARGLSLFGKGALASRGRVLQHCRGISSGTGTDTTEQYDVDRPLFSGIRADYTDKLEFINPDTLPGIPVYRVMNRTGQMVPGCTEEPDIDDDTLLKMYKTMTQLNVMDRLLYQSQRQGRISFYMTHFGEEGILIGTAAALKTSDPVWAQYREAGILMWRGFTIPQFLGQCYGNNTDFARGRNMPVHYGSKELNFNFISSPLATQICQASGCAYKLKTENMDALSAGKPEDQKIAICFFGDGAASEGDFHAGMNFAATLACPALFVCRNNGYAISTPTHDQYRGDGIAARGQGYGMLTLRVDGNDVLAVYNAVKKAKQLILEEHRPVLLEAMSYRVGHHSTSDDSSVYRSTDEVSRWEKVDSPISRFRLYLINKKIWTPEDDLAWAKEARKKIIDATKEAEQIPKPNFYEMFSDVYDKMPPNLKEQQEELRQHLNQYGQHYPIQQYTNPEPIAE